MGFGDFLAEAPGFRKFGEVGVHSSRCVHQHSESAYVDAANLTTSMRIYEIYPTF